MTVESAAFPESEPSPGPGAGSRPPIRPRGQHGASAVEFALVAPLLLLIVFGIIDFGLFLSSGVNVGNGVREGARIAVVDPDEKIVEAAVRKATKDLNQSKLTITIECHTPLGAKCPGGLKGATEGDTATISAVYTYELLSPLAGFAGLKQMTVDSTAHMRVE